MDETIFGLTDTGRERANNEDAFVIRHGRWPLAAVIDGVGGYEGGEVAAALAGQVLERLPDRVPEADALRRAFLEAHRAIVSAKRERPQLASMACVLTCVWLDEDAGRLTYAHVGDTRLYLYRDGTLVKLSHDHSFVGLLEDSGRISEMEAMQHLKRNEVDRALGFADPLPDPEQYIETGNSPFLPGDQLLLCSDGLTDLVDAATITGILRNANAQQQAAEALVDAANHQGGRDNITVVLVQHSRRRPVLRAPAERRMLPASQPVPPARPRKAVTSAPAPARSRIGLLGPGLALLLLLLLFYRIRRQDNAIPDEPTLPAGAMNLQDTIDHGPPLLRLLPPAFGDPLELRDTLRIEQDSLILQGAGRTVLRPAGAYAVLRVAPTVRHLLLTDLELRDVEIRIGSGNIDALQFHQAQLRNIRIGVGKTVQLADTLFTGAARTLVHPQTHRHAQR